MSPTTLLTNPTTTRPPEPDSTMTPPPAEHAPCTWTVTTVEGITLTGTQPDWSMDNPSDTGMTLAQAIDHLRGYAHYTMLPVDPVLPPAILDTDINGTRVRDSTSMMFAAQIACHPYAPHPHERVPTASLTIVEEWDFEGLTPTDLTRFATQIRTQADYFENTVLPELITARNDWTTHHSPIPDPDHPAR
ncbi:hypothetical protein RVR_5503 [Actinacidiphila reveromycinica]|uniref:Uncharacterized protein n=1 Tax=Actinacidiphila reveromycinica TaxID=659352 RepID=A0A7U3UUE2_9ACTN|nr:hypothetical protein [Streptomyces sp. SN-593]BBA99047.1 hypothetical protein RVR_5503 [Streptomyces sp. SN-593]